MTCRRPFAVLPRFRDTSLLVLPGRSAALPLREALRTVDRGITVATFGGNAGPATFQNPVAVYDDGLLIEAGAVARLVHGDGPYATLHREWLRGETP
ncbi:hypothetical protein FHR81_003153 [Actinoalloteichus hoggarensis]|uniref:Uncharacterized protein n=1 Tax=Actinoalloteichus hoggarensis TaxID=1470176 RepID=A0A221W6F3_9PSEU|nr:hypothetical protein [Actinoalloteichus hoggarensis]ASO21512.1 hypothetical protein AHOG_19450 [Actinoalloteichus hoggarensis]MBB5922101.1 hypothetical protein [Actinoalloteichus hoggarensis]